ncbi:MAG: adenylate/guanylate cyclase domain-containing protein [Alphaproteobacteria bacterium]|nr:adenylate/guanylate cyclase domain-containing protein [Alphaproteobacteria bacterium]
MNDLQPLFGTLRNSADAAVVDAIEALIRDGEDRALSRINVLKFAGERKLDEEKTISAFLHASRLGLFELDWNVLCPGCGGVLDSNHQLKSVHKEAYDCALCSRAYEPTLDEMVEVAFTVSPRVRHIAAHDPQLLPVWEYFRQTFWGSGVDLPEENFVEQMEQFTIDAMEIGPGEKAQLSLTLPADFVILFEPVTHFAHFIDVKGEPTKERQNLALIFNKSHAATVTTEMRPGPLRITMENKSDVRALPTVWIAAHHLHDLLGKRRPFLTAKRLLTNQTFRDVYRTDTLDVDQGLKITSLTFLFTDLKGSTSLYDRVGDIAAYDIVREHFRVLGHIVATEAGAVVKTIGDAVMATFPTPDRALAAAFRMRDTIKGIRDGDLLIKIGIHEGPCLAVTLNDRLDYFGQTVNVASRVQSLADAKAIFATKPVVENPRVAEMLAAAGLVPTEQLSALRGVADKMPVFQIP